MERNDRIHPSDPEPDETRDDPIFPDDIKHDGVEDSEDDKATDILVGAQPTGALIARLRAVQSGGSVFT